ncbi:MAG: hypothetical protein JJE51_06695 [Thermoanaerobaculia bacterium]|nr:hypothetical protein [Thermoanaerobaculia bacterium]
MTTLILTLLLSAPAIDWPRFFSTINASGVTYSDELKALEGKRVRLRGYSVLYPKPDGAIFVTCFGHSDPHGVEEHDLPFDAVAVIWRKELEIPPVPLRPTVEGTLRLGNRRFGENEVVTITLEDAIPIVTTHP